MMRDCFPPHGAPCASCGVRPDVACAHREADPGYHPPAQDGDPDRRRKNDHSGLNFGTRKVQVSGGGLYALGDVLRNRRRKAQG